MAFYWLYPIGRITIYRDIWSIEVAMYTFIHVVRVRNDAAYTVEIFKPQCSHRKLLSVGSLVNSNEKVQLT